MTKSAVKAGRLDIIGTVLSVACAIHCLAFPLLIWLGAIAAAGGIFSELTEKIVFGVSIVICGWSLFSSYSYYRKPTPFVFLGLSIVLIGASLLVHGEALEVSFSVAGGLCIATAHLLNRRFLRKHSVAAATH